MILPTEYPKGYHYYYLYS